MKQELLDKNPFDFFGIGNYSVEDDKVDPEKYTNRLARRYTQMVRQLLQKFQSKAISESEFLDWITLLDRNYKCIESYEARQAYETGKSPIMEDRRG